MKRTTVVLSAFLLACAAFSAPVQASSITVTVTVDTSGLGAFAPYALNFQLNDGGGTVTNTAVLTGFDFGGGSALGAPSYTGGASGDLSTAVSLTDARSFFNEFTQDFLPGLYLSFTLLLSTNVEASFPDQFSMGLMSQGVGIPTSFFDVFVLIDIDALRPAAFAFGSIDPNNPVPTPIATVPEPGLLTLLAAGLVLAGRKTRGRLHA
jgi:hypothetical protein